MLRDDIKRPLVSRLTSFRYCTRIVTKSFYLASNVRDTASELCRFLASGLPFDPMLLLLPDATLAPHSPRT